MVPPFEIKTLQIINCSSSDIVYDLSGDSGQALFLKLRQEDQFLARKAIIARVSIIQGDSACG